MGLNDLEWVYARIPSVACKGLCWESCANIALGKAELAKIEELRPTETEQTVIDERALMIVNGPDGRCPHLEDRRCSVYDVRPGICRLFGVAEGMACPFGCKPFGRLLTPDEGGAIIRTLLDMEEN